jgi:hypothetical protein
MNIESYFDNIGDQYLNENLILQRDPAGMGYYLESITDNIARPRAHPTFNEGPTFTPSVEEVLEEEYESRMPKSQQEIQQAMAARRSRTNYARYSQGHSSRNYDTSGESLNDSFGNIEYRSDPYGAHRTGFESAQRMPQRAAPSPRGRGRGRGPPGRGLRM